MQPQAVPWCVKMCNMVVCHMMTCNNSTKIRNISDDTKCIKLTKGVFYILRTHLIYIFFSNVALSFFDLQTKTPVEISA